LLSIFVLHVRPFGATERQIGYCEGEGRGRQWVTVIVGGDHARRSPDQSNPRDLDTLTRGVSRLDSMFLCVENEYLLYKACWHVYIYIATTFTGNIFFWRQTGNDCRRTTGEMRLRRRKRTWSSRKLRYLQPCVACTVSTL